MPLTEDTFFLDPNFKGSLQTQIRQIVAGSILAGRIRHGDRLPSSRRLADHLGISRITVTLAYQDLVADGYLESRDRSGYFVADTAPLPELSASGARASGDSVDWDRVLRVPATPWQLVEKTLNWRDYRYPFIYGQTDPTLFSHSAWRSCAHQALGLRDIDSLTADYASTDDPQLIDFIVRQTLPRRGIAARPEEVLITAGAQNALWLTAELLLGPGKRAAFENPGYPGLRAVLSRSGADVMPINVDADGLPPDLLPDDLTAAFVTPSHHAPTTVTMPMIRRRQILERAKAEDFVVIEDDYEFEMAYLRPPTPALKSIDEDGRVIYVGSFSKSLFPGLRLGYLVGPERFIEAARSLRTVTLRHLPGHIQRTTAYFLERGHYDALVKRMRDAFAERREVMAREFDLHGLRMATEQGSGGTSFWMRAPEGVDTDELALALREKSVLIEPGRPFFAGLNKPRNFYRLAYSSVPASAIPAGIDRLSGVLKEMTG